MLQPKGGRNARSPAIWAVTATIFLIPAAYADEKQSPTQREITDLIEQLGHDEFTRRLGAQQALQKIGMPASKALEKAIHDTSNLEIRRRATTILGQIDPAWKRRSALLKEIEAAKGVDVKNWAESIANPFVKITDEGKKKLAAEGIEVTGLQKMRARYLTGSYAGANGKEFVNTDPDTILVVGKGFCAHKGVSSAGPILAVENAYFMSRVKTANLLWFVDRAGASGGVMGAPVLAAEGAGLHAVRETFGILVGDYGWRSPKSFLQPLTAADAKNDPPPTEELAKAKKEYTELIKNADAVDASKVAKVVANPFTALTEEGKAKLRFRGIDPDRLPKLKALYLTGNFCGAAGQDFVNNDPDTVLVLGKGFITHRDIYSLGPILAVGDAHFMGHVTGADIVWFSDMSFPRGNTRGAPVILGPAATHSQMRIESKQTWHGDYGWRTPKDFMEQAERLTDTKK
jgi:hypothetical protein